MPEMWFCVFKNCEERMEKVDAGRQQYDKRNIGRSSLSSPSPLRQSLLKFQTAYHNYKQPRFILKELSSERASEP